MSSKEFLGKYSVFCSDIHRFGTDAVLLANFANAKRAKNACDLGCGCGIIPFLLFQDNEKLSVTAVDIQEDAIELVKQGIEYNRIGENITPVNCDLKTLDVSYNDKYDLVTMNPPYKKKGAGKITGIDGIDIARNEIMCTFDDVCKAAYKLLMPMGKFCVCQRAERLVDVIFDMKSNGIEPKVIRNVINKKGSKPMLVLVMGQKCGNAGADVLADLILKDDNNEDTEEVKEIYKLIRGKM